MRLTPRRFLCLLGENFLTKPLDHYSRYRPSALTMRQYLEFGRQGTAESSYLFLRKELLIRMAHIMQEFNLLPPALLKTQNARIVGGWYAKSFEELLQFESVPPSEGVGARFNDQLRTILHRHATVVETMAEALLELRDTEGNGSSANGGGIDIGIERNIQYFLNRFYLNRISIRMLQNQHLSLFEQSQGVDSGHVGYIDPHCDVHEVIVDAYENARFLCEHHYSNYPPLQLQCLNTMAEHNGDGETTVRLAVVPLHLYYIVFELMKNAMRATVEHHPTRQLGGGDLPPLAVRVVLGRENLSIKISDRGGGVPHSKLRLLFHYLYSTAPKPKRGAHDGNAQGNSTPFAGYGYGLPISRLYTRYLLGDLFLVSMDGWGTDALIHLKANTEEASELLPVYSGTSRSQITMGRKVADWCFQVPRPVERSSEDDDDVPTLKPAESATAKSTHKANGKERTNKREAIA